MPSKGQGTRAHRIALLRPDGGIAPPSRSRLGSFATPAAPTTPPVELLQAASRVRGCKRLSAAADLRLTLIDAAVEPDGTAGAVRRALELSPSAVVMRAGRGEDPQAMVDAGRSLVKAGRQTPTRVAIVEDNLEAAARLLTEDAADVVVRGELEEPISNVIGGALDGRNQWEGVRGVSWRPEQGEVRHEEPTSRPAALAQPAWDLVDLESYGAPQSLLPRLQVRLRRLRGQQPAPSQHAASVRTMIACGPECTVCHGSYGHSPIARPADEVLAEINELVEARGVRHLRIDDDAFDGLPERAEQIVRGIGQMPSVASRSLKVEFPRGFRGDGLTPSLVEALMGIGLRRFRINVGSAAPRLQRLLKRNISLDRSAGALEAIDRAGGVGHLDLLLGLPTETAGETARTIRWASSSAAHLATFSRGADHDLGPLWRRSTGISSQAHEDDDFAAMRRRAVARFYRSPGRLARLARATAMGLPRLARLGR